MKRLILALFLLAAPTYAETIYVDINLGVGTTCSGSTYSIANRNCSGSDGRGFGSIGTAVGALAAGGGHMVYIRGGTYTEIVSPGSFVAGASDAWNTLSRYGSETPLLDNNSTNTSIYKSAQLPVGSYWIVDGLTFDGDDSIGVWTASEPSAGTSNITWRNCTFQNYDRDSIPDAPTVLGKCYNRNSPGNGGHCIALTIQGTSGIVVENNTFTDTHMAVYGGYTNGSNVIRNNTTTGGDWGFQWGYDTYNADGTKNVYGAGCVIEKNLAYQTGEAGIAVGSGCLVRNNIVWGAGTITAAGGINVYGNATGPRIYNNTLVANNGGGIQASGTFVNGDFQNNILASNTGYAIHIGEAGNFFSTNNLMYGNSSGGIWAVWGSYTETGTIASDPTFTDAVGHDYTLQAGSPALDAAVTLTSVTEDYLGTVRPQGAGYDVGAYEKTAAAPDPPSGTLVTYDAQSSTSGTGTSINWNHLFSASGNRAALIGCTLTGLPGPSTPTLTGVTVGGAAATLVKSAPWYVNHYLYGITAPSSGEQSIVATFSGSTTAICGCVSAINAHQTFASAFRTPATSNTWSTSPISVAVPSGNEYDLIVDLVSGQGTPAAFSDGASQTERWEANTGGIRASMTTAVGSLGDVTMSHTPSSGSWAGTQLVGVAIAPAAASADTTDPVISITSPVITSVTESFTGDGALSGDWTHAYNPSGTHELTRVDGAAQCDDFEKACDAYYSGATFANDQYVEFTFTRADPGSQWRAILRASGTGVYDGYVAWGLGGSGQIGRYFLGAYYTIATFTDSVVSGDRIRFQAVGANLRVIVNGALIAEGTDASIASGSPGLGGYDLLTHGTFDDFAAGSLTADGAIVISGTASDDTELASVSWSSNTVGSGPVVGTTTWTTGVIILAAGSNTFTVTATDGAGNTATDTITAIYAPPVEQGATGQNFSRMKLR